MDAQMQGTFWRQTREAVLDEVFKEMARTKAMEDLERRIELEPMGVRTVIMCRDGKYTINSMGMELEYCLDTYMKNKPHYLTSQTNRHNLYAVYLGHMLDLQQYHLQEQVNNELDLQGAIETLPPMMSGTLQRLVALVNHPRFWMRGTTMRQEHKRRLEDHASDTQSFVSIRDMILEGMTPLRAAMKHDNLDEEKDRFTLSVDRIYGQYTLLSISTHNLLESEQRIGKILF